MRDKLYKDKGATALTNIISVRRNLLVMGCLLFACRVWGEKAEIKSFLGIACEDTGMPLVSQANLFMFLALIVAYYLVNFIFLACSEIMNNRCETTGLKPENIDTLEHKTVMGLSNGAETNNVAESLPETQKEYSTLITWFEYYLEHDLNRLNKSTERVINLITNNFVSKEPSDQIDPKIVSQLQSEVEKLSKINYKQLIQTEINKMLTQNRWSALNKFHNYYRNLISLNNIRALIIDYILPVAISTVALFTVYPKYTFIGILVFSCMCGVALEITNLRQYKK